jgi:pre-mRNA-splicing helicase BRR2
MELSQMIVQGQWARDSALLQIPHFSLEIIDKCKNFNPPVESVFDFLELEEESRSALLTDFSSPMLSDVALFCNSYPNIELTFQKSFEDSVTANSQLSLLVSLQRDIDENDDSIVEVGKVVSARYPYEKHEGWWLVLGDSSGGTILAVKRVILDRISKVVIISD